MKPTLSKKSKVPLTANTKCNESETSFSDEFLQRFSEITTLDRLLFIDIFVECLESDLAQIKQFIEKFKSTCQTINGVSTRMYSEKKKLVQKYVNCANASEKELLRKKIVRILYILLINYRVLYILI